MHDKQPWKRAVALSLISLGALSGCASKPPQIERAPVVECPRFQPSMPLSTIVEPESLPPVEQLMTSLRELRASLTALQQSLSQPAAPTATAPR